MDTSSATNYKADYWGSGDRGEEEMRFSNPVARNPWPHDMAITVEDHPFPLNLLLFIRQAWQLGVDADIPKLLPQPARGNSKAPDSASLPEWSDRWQNGWDRAWIWYQIADSMADESVRRVIRLFPDYGHRWPLWENSTAERPTKYTMEPADFGLSPSLTLRLRTWYDAWDAENLYDGGWSSPENETAWNVEGAKIAEQLREEVNAFADVEYDE